MILADHRKPKPCAKRSSLKAPFQWPKKPPGKPQRGVAIITALLIVTIAATISITISTRLQLDVRRTGNLITQDQAQFYLLAAEDWSQRILRQDKKDNKSDDLTETWAIEIPPLPVEGGSIQGRITDLHACINVNSLLENNVINSTTQNRLTQLFTNLGISGNYIQAMADWMDTDLETRNPDGAEDGHYLNLTAPYYTANTPLINSISELRLIKGFEDIEVYQQIEPYICALPDTDTSINVNTATAEVLKSLSNAMTDTLVQDIIAHREEDPFKVIANFTSFGDLKTILKGKQKQKLSTSSDYFLIRTQAKIGPSNSVMFSIVYRDKDGETKVVYRTRRTL
jgi:general secretion pathway protein K